MTAATPAPPRRAARAPGASPTQLRPDARAPAARAARRAVAVGVALGDGAGRRGRGGRPAPAGWRRAGEVAAERGHDGTRSGSQASPGAASSTEDAERRPARRPEQLASCGRRRMRDALADQAGAAPCRRPSPCRAGRRPRARRRAPPRAAGPSGRSCTGTSPSDERRVEREGQAVAHDGTARLGARTGSCAPRAAVGSAVGSGAGSLVGVTSSAESLDHVVDARGERAHVGRVDRGEHRHAQLVAAEPAVRLDVHDAVPAQHAGATAAASTPSRSTVPTTVGCARRVGDERRGPRPLPRPSRTGARRTRPCARPPRPARRGRAATPAARRACTRVAIAGVLSVWSAASSPSRRPATASAASSARGEPLGALDRGGRQQREPQAPVGGERLLRGEVVDVRLRDVDRQPAGARGRVDEHEGVRRRPSGRTTGAMTPGRGLVVRPRVGVDAVGGQRQHARAGLGACAPSARRGTARAATAARERRAELAERAQLGAAARRGRTSRCPRTPSSRRCRAPPRSRPAARTARRARRGPGPPASAPAPGGARCRAACGRPRRVRRPGRAGPWTARSRTARPAGSRSAGIVIASGSTAQPRAGRTDRRSGRGAHGRPQARSLGPGTRHGRPTA